MIEELTRLICVERIDDIPLLLAQLEKMNVAALLDQHFPTHGNWAGELSFGEVAVVWLAFITSQGDHRLNQLETWAGQRLTILSASLGKEVRALDFSDDRLAAILDAFSDTQAWSAFECDLNQNLLRVYDLPTQTIRLDSTSAKTYAGVSEDGLFQFGHSKDHRPDLAQVKVSLSTLDPLGIPLTTHVVGGNRADDPLYLPEIKQVQESIGAGGKTYIGDCKMGAMATRAYLARSGDYYLCPLAGKQLTPEELERLIEPILLGQQPLTPVYGPELEGKVKAQPIAEGYELSRDLSAVLEGREVTWIERRLVVRSLAQARQQSSSLDKRLARALTQIESLNERKQGKKRMSSSELEAKAEAIVNRERVIGLVEIEVETNETETEKRRYGKREAEVRVETISKVKAKVNPDAVEKAKLRLAWRVYATNTEISVFSIALVVMSYRGQYLIEGCFKRLKGKVLSLVPMYLQTESRIVGLIRMLMIALRLITLTEFVVRRRLSEEGEELKGVYRGQASRATRRPTTEIMLKAFEGISLSVMKIGEKIEAFLTPLSRLQERILELMGLSSEIYWRLVQHFLKPALILSEP